MTHHSPVAAGHRPARDVPHPRTLASHRIVMKDSGHFAYWPQALLGLVLVAIAATIFLMGVKQAMTPPPGPELVREMELAAAGKGPSHHLMGGRLRTTRSDGQVIVTAEDLPGKLCVAAGWDLARKGLLTVNGSTPQHISAARLSQLCFEDTTATIVWVPN